MLHPASRMPVHEQSALPALPGARGPRKPSHHFPLDRLIRKTLGLARPRPRVGRHSQQPPRKPKPREDRTNAHPPLSEAATFCTQPAASRSPEQQQRPPEQRSATGPREASAGCPGGSTQQPKEPQNHEPPLTLLQGPHFCLSAGRRRCG